MIKVSLFFSIYRFKHVLSAQKHHPIEMVHLCTYKMFWLRNGKNNVQLNTLIWRPGPTTDVIKFGYILKLKILRKD